MEVLEFTFAVTILLLLVRHILTTFSLFLHVAIATAVYLLLVKRRTVNAKKIKGQGQGILITGCDSGIGHATALRLESLGFTVFAGCLFPFGDGARKLRKQESERMHVVDLDVTSDESVNQALGFVTEFCPSGELLAVVNNAGINIRANVELATMEMYKRVAEVNLYGMVRVIKAFAPMIRQSKGRFVNVTSVKGRLAVCLESTYTITKWAGEALSDILRREMRRFGVKVVTFEPGDFAGLTGMLSPETRERMEADLNTAYRSASPDAQAVYGRAYIDALVEGFHRSSTWCAPTLAPVIDAMEDAVTNESPKARYLVDGSHRLLDKFCVFARLNPFLPEAVMDYLMTWFFENPPIKGLYEESHGIIANRMYDPVFNATFGMRTKETRWWDGGEPIWVTVRKHGLKSAVFFWPGSEAIIRGLRPNIWFPYNQSVPFQQRSDTVVSWFSNSSLNIDLAMFYFHEPDHTGHSFGPDSPEIHAKVADMDTLLGYIVQQFEAHGLFDTVNVIVTSDHGMTEVDLSNRIIDLSKLVDISAILRMPDAGPVAGIQAVDGMEEELLANLTKIDHVTTYRKEDIPDHWHYHDNRRILPILCVAEEGWMITKNATGHPNTEKGAHGFDNRLQSMKPIFYARGPNIRQNYTATPFNSVDIYRGIRPANNNGTLDNTRAFTVSKSTSGAANTGLNVTLMASFLYFWHTYNTRRLTFEGASESVLISTGPLILKLSVDKKVNSLNKGASVTMGLTP